MTSKNSTTTTSDVSPILRKLQAVMLCAVLAGTATVVSTASYSVAGGGVAAKGGGVYEAFDEDCYMVHNSNKGNGAIKSSSSSLRERKLGENNKNNLHNHITPQDEPSGPLDKQSLGPCRYKYPTHYPPANGGYLQAIDFFHFRPTHVRREECFLFCINRLAQKDQLEDALLIQAAQMGLVQVAKALYTEHNLDPLYASSPSSESGGFNAIQEAIRGGHAEIVQSLVAKNPQVSIDSLGRTVEDYVRLFGSPIRPQDALKYLSIDTTKEQSSAATIINARDLHVDYGDSGWDTTSDMPVVDAKQCDFDVYHGHMSRETFYNDYFTPGRPFVLRGATPMQEVQDFSKKRWSTTTAFHPKQKVSVGPTAYPDITGQEWCSTDMTINEIEQATDCADMPGIPMVHARHPTQHDFKELYPAYNGNQYHKNGGWRMLKTWFDPHPEDYNLAWQVFWGGNGSGATLHWHNAAINILYVGIKEWKIAPPKYRGWTGMPAKKATLEVDDSTSLTCTQQPGDLMYIPDHWGHLTINHGFAIGAAVIVPPSFQKLASSSISNVKKRIFFVHINKTGGTSMISMLSNRCSKQYTEESWGKGQRTFHATAHALIEHNGRDAWDDAYSFAIVRHPMARLVSNYFFLLGECQEDEGTMNKFMKKVCKDRLIPSGIALDALTDDAKIQSFHEYILKLYEAYPLGSPQHYLFGGHGHGNERFETLNATQTSWLVDERGEMVVQNIFKLEDIGDDMGKLVNDLPCLGGDGGLTHANSSPKYPSYKRFAGNREVDQIVKQVFEVDFRTFGYE